VTLVRWLLVALLLVAAGPVSAQTARPVRVGTYADEPLVFRDAGGAPKGIYIDLLEEIARKQGWTLRYVEGTWDECLQRLQRGEIDLLVAIGYSEERTRLFDFSREPVVVNWGQVYVAPGSPIRSLLDLTGRTLAVLRGDVYYESLKRTQDILKVFPTFVEVDSYRETLRLVAEGRAEAALVPRIFGAYHERLFAVEKTTIMFSPTELRFAAPKGTQGPLLATLDRELRALKADKRSAYYRALNVWIEGVRTLVFPKWLNPFWVVGGAASVGVLIVGMNLLLRRQVRLRTAALKASLAAQEKIASELRIAREIQMSSIPHEYPAMPGWDIYGVLQPAREVGGDFYDCALLDERRLYVTLGDVSDKGVPAALFMASSRPVERKDAHLVPCTRIRDGGREVCAGVGRYTRDPQLRATDDLSRPIEPFDGKPHLVGLHLPSIVDVALQCGPSAALDDVPAHVEPPVDAGVGVASGWTARLPGVRARRSGGTAGHYKCGNNDRRAILHGLTPASAAASIARRRTRAYLEAKCFARLLFVFYSSPNFTSKSELISFTALSPCGYSPVMISSISL